jgi:glycyl-tRNA synthetase
MAASSLEQVVSLAKRRGFIFQSSEIYGGAAAAYDYGPLGVELKNNLKRLWWEEMTRSDESIVGLDAAIFMHPKVWEASGHVQSFTDLLVECHECHKRYRPDHLLGDERFAEVNGDANALSGALQKEACPHCGVRGTWSEPRQFNLMFTTHLGVVEGEGATVYLRPETAQGIYVDAHLVASAMRLKVPFGIAQIGKAFRNEVTPGNFLFRTVEFEQMEMQFFVKPRDADAWFKTWKERRWTWYARLGFTDDAIRFYPHGRDELAHYAKAAEDIQFHMPFGWQEIEGIHNRGDWDVRRHSEFSGKDLSFYDEETKEKFLPWIIEASAGADRVVLALLVHAFHEETVEGETRTVLRLPHVLVPVQVAVFPLLSNNAELTATAQEVSRNLREKFRVQYDDGGSIGRRYRRQDEIGTPFCVTIDHETLEDSTVTVRDRDAMEQRRVAIRDLPAFFDGAFAEAP